MEDGVCRENVFICETGQMVLTDVAVGTDDDGFNCGGHAEGVGCRLEGRFVGGHGEEGDGQAYGGVGRRVVLRF